GFQAEDGIRDGHVTGVQTCALRSVLGEGNWELRPLGEAWGPYFPEMADEDRDNFAYPEPLSEQFWRMYAEPATTILTFGVFLLRSEERRGGKEWRSRVMGWLGVKN